jgi:hypothetical protein
MAVIVVKKNGFKNAEEAAREAHRLGVKCSMQMAIEHFMPDGMRWCWPFQPENAFPHERHEWASLGPTLDAVKAFDDKMPLRF